MAASSNTFTSLKANLKETYPTSKKSPFIDYAKATKPRNKVKRTSFSKLLKMLK